MRKQSNGVVTPKYATTTMMVIYPLLGGLIRLDVSPGGAFSAGVMLGSFGGDDIFSLFPFVCVYVCVCVCVCLEEDQEKGPRFQEGAKED